MKITKQYDSYLESLPHDIFVQLLTSTDISANDLIALCRSSSEIKNKCHHKNDELYKKFLKNRLNINELYFEPFITLKYIASGTDLWDNNFLKTDYMSNNPISRSLPGYKAGNTDLIIPNFVIIAFVNELSKEFNVSIESILKEINNDIIYNHMGTFFTYSNGNGNTFLSSNISRKQTFEVYDKTIDNKVKILAKLPNNESYKTYSNNRHIRYMINGIIMKESQYDDLIKHLKKL